MKIVILETVLKCVQKKLLELKCDLFYEIGIRFNETNPHYFSANNLHSTKNEVIRKKIKLKSRILLEYQ